MRVNRPMEREDDATWRVEDEVDADDMLIVMLLLLRSSSDCCWDGRVPLQVRGLGIRMEER